MAAPRSRHATAALLALAATSALLITFCATATQAQIVADRPWPIPGLALALPAGAVLWLAPGVIAAAALAALMPLMPLTRLFARPRSSALWAALLVSAGTLLLVWLLTLVRRDAALSAWQLVAMGLAAAALVDTVRARLRVLLVLAPLTAVVSYSVIWGEAPCDQQGGMSCLVQQGPRLWMPAALSGLGIHPFADLRGLDLRGARLGGRDLRNADLRGAQLDSAVLARSYLRRARLDGVSAPGSDWRGAFMNGASMTSARLIGADLREVQAYLIDVSHSDLRDADLRGASLSHARLHATRLDGAHLGGTYLRFTEGLSPAQMRGAQVDERTLLPAAMAAGGR